MAQKRSSSAPSAPIKKIREINEKYALTLGDIAEVLDVERRTLTRWTKSKESSELISEQKTDRLLVLESLLKLGIKVFGSGYEFNQWLHQPVFALDGNKPIDLIKTESGRRKVESVLHQIEHGIF